MNKKLVTIERVTDLLTKEVEMKLTYNPHGLSQSVVEQLLWCKEHDESCWVNEFFSPSELRQVKVTYRESGKYTEVINLIASPESWERARKSYEQSKKEF